MVGEALNGAVGGRASLDNIEVFFPFISKLTDTGKGAEGEAVGESGRRMGRL